MTSLRAAFALGAVLFCGVLVGAMAIGLPPLDAILLSVLLVAAPTLSIAQVRVVDVSDIERLPAYGSSIATLWMIGTACWLVGTRSLGPEGVGLVPLRWAPLVGWTSVLTAGCLAIVFVFRGVTLAVGLRDGPLLHRLLPQTGRERVAFAALSVAAGVGEELAYRGYVILVLTPWVGVWWAAALGTVVFGIMHGYQGTMGVLRSGAVGGALAWGFLASGSLWPPILAHTLVDLLAGLVFGASLLVGEEE